MCLLPECVYVYRVCRTHRGQKRMSGIPELDLQMVGRCLMWVMGAKLRPSGKTVGALNCWAIISPAGPWTFWVSLSHCLGSSHVRQAGQQAPRICLSSLLGAEIISAHHQTQFLSHGFWGIRFRPSCLYGWPFINWAVSSVSEEIFLNRYLPLD